MNGAPSRAAIAGTPDGYPSFSESERSRRWALVRRARDEVGASVLVCYGADRSGSCVEWLTGWPVTREAVLVLAGDEQPALFVQHANHVPNAARVARGVEVSWGGPSTFDTVARHVRAVARPGRVVASVGSWTEEARTHLGHAVRIDRSYTRMRLVKSAEEIAFLSRGAALTDGAVSNLVEHAAPGTTEVECCALLEDGYLSKGGTNHVHYLFSTPMAAPERHVPAQLPSSRRISPGDVVACEVSASFSGYAGQLLRTFTVGSGPTPEYAALHEAATEVFAALASAAVPGATVGDLRRAASPLARSGLTTCDDLVHGFGGGYLPPVLPGGDRPGGTRDDFVLEEGMAIVIQPNPVDLAFGRGVQTGELGVVTAAGWTSLHGFPRGLGVLGG
ncbi:MAG: M24 family metallopeptidase [Actinomycetota bacterium]|nr:M24 family metallopeptidase [Actinomycetota bacterium]